MGTLRGVEVDTAEGRIRYLHVKGEGSRSDGVIPWEFVRAVGTDAITVEGASTLRETVPDDEREGLTGRLSDRPVMTEGGQSLGNITSYEVDEATGRVECYHVAAGGTLARLTGKERTFPHTAVRSFGQDTIIVADEAGEAQAA